MAAGQTVVTYNGIRILQCHTRRFEEVAVYDDSNTDLLYHQFTVSVVGYVTGDSEETSLKITPIAGGGSAAFHHVSIRSQLLTPRATFKMEMGVNSAGAGGRLLLYCRAHSGIKGSLSNLDVNNGPKPRNFRITHVSADNVYKVEMEWEICVLQCDRQASATENRSGVLSNRWSVIDNINEDFFTTRTWRGRLRAATSITSPNEFRDFVVPPLQDGMQRKTMNFVVTSDGLNLDYLIVDVEVAFSAPAPATHWRVSHTESFGENALIQYGDVDIVLGGDRNTDKKELIVLAAAIIEAKVLGAQFGVIGGEFQSRIMNLSITDIAGNDQKLEIHAHCRVQHLKFGDDDQNVAQRIGRSIGRIGRPITANVIAGLGAPTGLPPYDSNLSRGGRPGDKLEVEGPIPMVTAFSTYLQNSCNPTHKIYNGTAQKSPPAESQNTPGIATRVVPILPLAVPNYMSIKHVAAPYTYFKMESKYSLNTMKVHLPKAVFTSRSGSGTQGQNASTSSVVNLSGGIATRIVTVQAERLGKWPNMPLAQDYTDSNGIKYVLMESFDYPETPDRGPDGEFHVFRMRSEYHFALNRMPRINERLDVGQNPWEKNGLFTTDENTRQGEVLG